MIITDPNIYEEAKKEKYFEQHLKSIDQFFENINTEKLDLIERYLFDFLKHSVKNYPNFFISTLSDAYKGKTTIDFTKKEFQEIESELKHYKYWLLERFPNKGYKILELFDINFIKKGFENGLLHESVNIDKNITSIIKKFKRDIKRKPTINNWEVNEVYGEINSKFVDYAARELELQIKLLKDIMIPLDKKILNLKKAREGLLISTIFFGSASAISGIFSFMFPALVPVFTGFSLLTSGVLVVEKIIHMFIKYYEETTNWLRNLLDEFSSVKFKDIISFLFRFNKFWNSSKQMVKVIKEMAKKVSSNATISTLVKSFGDAYSAIMATINYFTIVNEINEKAVQLQKLFDFSGYLENQLNILEKIQWVVINETPLDKPYEEGGKGGKNIIFKNRKTGELFALDKLLSKPQYELNLLGLLKIFNPKLNEWYIRTLPNKSKLDNLG
ncbi:hypothetical protein [Metamycoplasma equirhinis]|uniref:hypothetical protein n=2 Tax=Metamycoplasma equirhinis TaxID=92402 RepID=UPI003593AA46